MLTSPAPERYKPARCPVSELVYSSCQDIGPMPFVVTANVHAPLMHTAPKQAEAAQERTGKFSPLLGPSSAMHVRGRQKPDMHVRFCLHQCLWYCYLQMWCTSSHAVAESHAATAESADPTTHNYPGLELVLTFSNCSNASLMPRDLPFLGHVYSVAGLDQGS